MFPEPQLVSLLLMYLCSSCVCVHSRQNKEGRGEKRKTLQAFLHLSLPFALFLPLACFRSLSLSLTEVHHKNKAYEGRSSLIATGEPDCTLRWRNGRTDRRHRTGGRDTHSRQTAGRRRTAHARTHRYEIFRHLFRRLAPSSTSQLPDVGGDSGWGGRKGLLDDRGERAVQR